MEVLRDGTCVIVELCARRWVRRWGGAMRVGNEDEGGGRGAEWVLISQL